MPQTTIQKSASLRAGSIKIQVGDDFSSLVDIGAIRKPKLTPLVESQVIEFDNTDPIKQFVKGKRLRLSFTLAEINLTNLAKFDAGWITLSTVAGTPVVITNELMTITADQAKRLTNKNGDNTKVTISAVNLAPGGAAQVEGTAYEVFVDADGYTNIVKIGAGSADIEVDYTYTPAASKKIAFTDNGKKTYKVIRMINTDSAGKQFRVDMENVSNVEAPEITFPSDTDADVATMPISLEGTLKEWVDEQNVT